MSLLFDETLRYWDSCPSDTTLSPPDNTTLRRTVEEFKASLNVSDQVIRKIENNTRQQRNSPLWYNVRRYRITASMFGNTLRRKLSTPPDRLVLSILQPKVFTSAAIEWGVQQEATAIQQYVSFQQSHSHPDITVSPCGFHVSRTHPYLGATQDGAVYDPTNLEEQFGFIEVKCPYVHRNTTPAEACSTPAFCCSLHANPDGTTQLALRHNHITMLKCKGKWPLAIDHGVTL